MAEKIVPKKTMKGIRFYNVSDLAKILNITEFSARVYLRQNKIPGVKVGRKWYIRERSLNDFLLCKGIRNMPDDEMVEMINKAVEIKFIFRVDRKSYTSYAKSSYRIFNKKGKRKI
ncbi:hypothetical protein ES703_30722 [subsurface metagenome]